MKKLNDASLHGSIHSNSHMLMLTTDQTCART